MSCRLGEIRHLGRHPFRMFADTSSGRDIEMLSQSRCPKCGAAGSPAADRCGSLCRSWRVEFPLGKETGNAKGEGLGRLSPCFWSMDGRLLGPERLPAGWARRVRGPRAGSARRAPPARVRQAARFPQGAGVPSAGAGPQPLRPGPLQQLPHQQRAFPVRPFRQQLRGPQEPRFPQQRPERQGQRRSGAGRRRA